MQSEMGGSELAEEHFPFVDRVVRQVMSRYKIVPNNYRDFLGAAYLGLLEAAERYDTSSHVPFKKYAYLRVRGAVIDHIRNTSGQTPTEYRAAKMLKASECFAQDMARIRPILDGAESDVALAKVLEYAANGALLFRMDYQDHEEEVLEFHSPPEAPDEKLEREELRALVLDTLQELPQRERQIIEAYYFHGLSLRQIADDLLGVGRSWVCRMHARALKELRKRVEAKLEERGDE